MATYISYSHSPRVRVGDPVTPIHSPHHSVNSSTSSRTPLQTLTLHEYRKQQNSPASQTATPPGKTLRRKAAAPALNEVERVPLVTRTPLSGSRPVLSSLHFSKSAHQLTSYQPLPPSPPHFSQHPLPDTELRSQSAEPRRQGSTASDLFSDNKVRTFKPIKRLPKPAAANGAIGPPPLLATVTSTLPRLSPLRTASFPSPEGLNSSETQTTPSTFSLSQFPQPPHLIDPSFSPPNDRVEAPRVNTASFATTAPATPPATPAVIHYRGASFDLVNPHDSWQLHEVVTPSRDLDSTDYLPLGSSEDPLAYSEMAPKRALYGDLSAAHASIAARRNESAQHPPNLDLPLPPPPIAQSPGSSQYTSPPYSPDSNAAVSPLAIKKPNNDSRFSLKQLTRTLTKKLGKSPEKVPEEELQDFSASRLSLASADFDGQYPRPLEQSYRILTPKSSLHADEPHTPLSPLDSSDNARDSEVSMEYPRFSNVRYSSAPLSSLLPEEPSTQVGRGADPRSSMSEGDMLSKLYYDDLHSIYPSSSVYTGDDRDYPPSLASTRRSHAFTRKSGGADALASEFNPGNLYGPPDSRRTSHRASRPLTQEVFRPSIAHGNEKTDTISKFIDQYNPSASQHNSTEEELVRSASGAFLDPSYIERPHPARTTSGLSQFEFDIPEKTEDDRGGDVVSPVQPVRARRPTIAAGPRFPPLTAAPLAPAFEYDEEPRFANPPNPSEMFSGASSYGDTRNLLHLSQPHVAELVSSSALNSAEQGRTLEPSSSYSQQDIESGTHTPQEALDEAEKIFDDARTEQQEKSIPSMWMRRGSGNLLRRLPPVEEPPENEQEEEINAVVSGDVEEDNGDWETVGNNSVRGGIRHSFGESIANYSSSEGSEDSLDQSSSFPAWRHGSVERHASYYHHPDPVAAHDHPFASSPPPLATRASVRSAPNDDSSRSPMAALPMSTTAPAFRDGNDDQHDPGSHTRPGGFAPWVNPFAFSDKETQELLASGPNEEILYDDSQHRERGQGHGELEDATDELPTTSSPATGPFSLGLERENTFEKFSIVGPKGNLTGTPQGTGMHETGSSEADNSSPGMLSSSPYDRSRRSGFAGHYGVSRPRRASSVRPGIPSSDAPSDRNSFYVTPGYRSSITRIPPRQVPSSESEHDRSPSQVTLFPRVIPDSHYSGPSRRSSRSSLRSSTQLPRPRRGSRAAVPGQTKLRHMVLAPEVQTVSSANSTHVSRFIRTGNSEAASSTNTHTPLRTYVSESTLGSVFPSEHSPHLLCPERAINPEEEEQRRKLSWAIFAVFCLLPPLLILYRFLGDFVIVNVTKGRITHASPKPKRVALVAGICVNVGLSSAILLPILIAHATGHL